jgi:hypothetical protein
VRERRNAFKSLVGKLERKRPLGRPRRRWDNAILKKYTARIQTDYICLRIGFIDELLRTRNPKCVENEILKMRFKCSI